MNEQWDGKERRMNNEHIKPHRPGDWATVKDSILAFALIPVGTFGLIFAGYALYQAIKYVKGI